MFLRAGALSLALLLASRLLGLLRESALAAAFGSSGLADVVVLMLTLPDWLAGVLASGALAYVLLPAWAGRTRAEVASMQRRAAMALLAGGSVLALAMTLWRRPALEWLVPGLTPALVQVAVTSLAWSAWAVPAALLAALWVTRLQHEQDFTGMYAANLLVNAVLIATLAAVAALSDASDAIFGLGAGLMAAMLLRLAWLRWRHPVRGKGDGPGATPGAAALPAWSVWLWAAAAAGLPLTLPFAARSIASQSGAGALATFNYGWKLVELPLVLAVQLVATLAFPAVTRAIAEGDERAAKAAARSAFALAWTLACAAAAALLAGGPAVARLLFGYGRMEPAALERVAAWGAIGAWGLLPQSVIAVALTVLASRGRMIAPVAAYAAGLAALLVAGARGGADGATLMALLNMVFAAIAIVAWAALGREARRWLPWRAMASALVVPVLIELLTASGTLSPGLWALGPGLLAAALSAGLALAATWWASSDLRLALHR